MSIGGTVPGWGNPEQPHYLTVIIRRKEKVMDVANGIHGRWFGKHEK